MPKRASIFLAVIALTLPVAACGGNSTPTASPTAVPSITPNPKDTTAKINVTILGTPVPKVAVEISTPKSSASPRPGTPFNTETTDKNGTATFKNLKPSKTYCFVADLTASQSSSICTPFYIWQGGPVQLGT